MKELIIAEKPSVARDLASALGNVKKSGDHFESDRYVICSAVGHLVELFMPEDIDKKLRFWSLGSLPIIPESFNLKPISRTKAKFNEIKKHLKRKDIEGVINACDAGREGELIFTYIYELAKCKKPVKRLWLSSMTKQSIQDAFNSLRSQEEMIPLQDAARSRSESDWLIGINGTRAVTKRMYGSRSRGKQVATLGRVQTPTLAIVVDREQEIRHFKAKKYQRIIGRFAIASGQYEGLFQRPDYKKSSDKEDKPDRIWNPDFAEQVVEECNKNPVATVTETKKRTRQVPPQLYDLTSLQREANNRYGLPANLTLSIAQSLYERHKMITYPRTDSKALPEDYIDYSKQVLEQVKKVMPTAEEVLLNKWVKPNRRIFNNNQVSDHFAIIPTGQLSGHLNGNEEKIYQMILNRFVAVFFPSAEYDVTTRFSKVSDHLFLTEGRVLIKAGWLKVYERTGSRNGHLPPLSSADGNPYQARVASLEMKDEETKPPPRFTDATLLTAMEGAGKFVEDEELADAMKENGLGTPATRAQIIEHLIALKYMERKKRELVPTGKGESLLEFLKAAKIIALTSPTMTGEWEHRLRQIERGELTRKDFMEGIADQTKLIVDRTREFEESEEDHILTDIISPTDKMPLLETLRSYRSQDGKLTVYKMVSNRRITKKEIRSLVDQRQIGPLDGFQSKSGRPFSATLKLNDEFKVKFEFENGNGNGAENGENGQPVVLNLEELKKIGTCPIDGGTVYETPLSFSCENGLNEKRDCRFRISRKMLSKDLDSASIKKLLTEKKTELIEGFISKRTKKPFSAYLIVKGKGSIGFEFPPRPPRKKVTPGKEH